MPITEREKTIITIVNAITVYSTLMKDENTVPKDTSVIQFILTHTPTNLKNNITIELIDEIFEYMSTVRNDYM